MLDFQPGECLSQIASVLRFEREQERMEENKRLIKPKKGHMSRGLHFPVLSCTALSSLFLNTHTYCPIPASPQGRLVASEAFW